MSKTIGLKLNFDGCRKNLVDDFNNLVEKLNTLRDDEDSSCCSFALREIEEAADHVRCGIIGIAHCYTDEPEIITNISDDIGDIEYFCAEKDLEE